MTADKPLICALDVTSPDRAHRLVRQLDGIVDFFKVGMLLYLVDGKAMVDWLLKQGKRVFLDLKFYDVPDTVGPAVQQAARIGVHFLTVHGNREILKRAGEAAAGTGLQILAVTVLTSLDGDDIKDLGFSCNLEELVVHRARQAMECGCAGVVASAREAALIRERLGTRLLVVTPGIRPAGGAVGTHKRAVTPAEAIRAGADYLVVGQPIIKAAEPAQAAQAIMEEIERERMK